MPCKDKEALLHAYLDGELDLRGSLEFEEHLKECTECKEELQTQQNLRKALQGAEAYQRAPGRLEARVRKALPQTNAPVTAVRGRMRTVEWLALAAAITVAVFLGLRIAATRIHGGDDLVAHEVVASHVRSLQPGHLMDVVSTDQHTVKPWFNGRVDFAPTVNDFSAQGFPLTGGRLDSIEGRSVAALVYQRRKHVINVLIWPDETKTESAARAEEDDGFHLVHWRNGGMNYWMISDVDPADLRELAGLMKPQS